MCTVVLETVTVDEGGGARYGLSETLGVARKTMTPDESWYLNRHRKSAQTVSEGVRVREGEIHTKHLMMGKLRMTIGGGVGPMQGQLYKRKHGQPIDINNMKTRHDEDDGRVQIKDGRPYMDRGLRMAHIPWGCSRRKYERDRQT